VSQTRASPLVHGKTKRYPTRVNSASISTAKYSNLTTRRIDPIRESMAGCFSLTDGTRGEQLRDARSSLNRCSLLWCAWAAGEMECVIGRVWIQELELFLV